MKFSPVITGVGTISSAGTGLEALSLAVASSQPQFSKIITLPEQRKSESTKNVHLIKNKDFSKWVSPNKSRRMGSLSLFAVVAGKMALANAGIKLPEIPDPNSSIILSNTFGPSSITQAILDQHFGDGPSTVSPFFFSESVTNSPSAQIAIHCAASGANHTISATEAGPILAVVKGAQDIQSGRIERALVGSVEEISPIVTTILDQFGALATAPSIDLEKARPFDRKRNGFTLAEGSTVLILENGRKATKRGGKALGKISGWGVAFDPTAPPTNWGKGVHIFSRGIQSSLKKCGISPADIDLVVSGASGTVNGDSLEAKVLTSVWKDQKFPPILAPKAITGEFGGAFLAAAILAVNGFPFGPPTWFDEKDPDLGINPNEPYDSEKIKKILVTSLGFGGAGAWLILDRS